MAPPSRLELRDEAVPAVGERAAEGFVTDVAEDSAGEFGAADGLVEAFGAGVVGNGGG